MDFLLEPLSFLNIYNVIVKDLRTRAQQPFKCKPQILGVPYHIHILTSLISKFTQKSDVPGTFKDKKCIRNGICPLGNLQPVKGKKLYT